MKFELICWDPKLFTGAGFHLFLVNCKNRAHAISFVPKFCSHWWTSLSFFCVVLLHAPFNEISFCNVIVQRGLLEINLCRVQISCVNTCLHVNWPNMFLIVNLNQSCRWCICGAMNKHICLCVVTLLIQRISPKCKSIWSNWFIICWCFAFVNFDLMCVCCFVVCCSIYQFILNKYVVLSILNFKIVVAMPHWFSMHVWTDILISRLCVKTCDLDILFDDT